MHTNIYMMKPKQTSNNGKRIGWKLKHYSLYIIPHSTLTLIRRVSVLVSIAKYATLIYEDLKGSVLAAMVKTTS